MARSELTGSRIRALRMDRGLRQAELARRCEISSSYLNLIEHNRRRIGGALLVRLAKELDADAAALTEGAGSALTAALEAAASRHAAAAAEAERAEDFAGRFPGWARLIGAQHREAHRLERIIEGLTDRLSHDPYLSASLHEVLSSVTAIRSSSAILAEGGEIAPEWQARFHRNILEDSRRLTESAEQLVTYLDAGADTERVMSLPQEDVETWLEERGWHVFELEADPGADIDSIIEAAAGLDGAAARYLAQRYLIQYAEDARAVPRSSLVEAIEGGTTDPADLSARFGCTLPVIFRRLASLPDDAFPDARGRGLVACDGSGTLIFRRPILGFDVPRYSAACPLWSLFQALHRPMQPLRQTLRTTGRDAHFFTAYAVAEARYPGGFQAPAVVTSWMLIEPKQVRDAAEDVVDVGASCRICARPDCPARREPSLVASPG